MPDPRAETTGPPSATPGQLAHARREALEARAARAELKQAVADGNLTLEQLLEQGAHGTGDHIAGRIEIGDAILAVNGIGRFRAPDVLYSLNELRGLGPIEPDDRLSSLTAAQRAAIVDEVSAQLRL